MYISQENIKGHPILFCCGFICLFFNRIEGILLLLMKCLCLNLLQTLTQSSGKEEHSN